MHVFLMGDCMSNFRKLFSLLGGSLTAGPAPWVRKLPKLTSTGVDKGGPGGPASPNGRA